MIDLQEADEEDLKGLTGIGTVKAKRILNLRNTGVSLTIANIAGTTGMSEETWQEWHDTGVIKGLVFTEPSDIQAQLQQLNARMRAQATDFQQREAELQERIQSLEGDKETQKESEEYELERINYQHTQELNDRERSWELERRKMQKDLKKETEAKERQTQRRYEERDFASRQKEQLYERWSRTMGEDELHEDPWKRIREENKEPLGEPEVLIDRKERLLKETVKGETVPKDGTQEWIEHMTRYYPTNLCYSNGDEASHKARFVGSAEGKDLGTGITSVKASVPEKGRYSSETGKGYDQGSPNTLRHKIADQYKYSWHPQNRYSRENTGRGSGREESEKTELFKSQRTGQAPQRFYQSFSSEVDKTSTDSKRTSKSKTSRHKDDSDSSSSDSSDSESESDSSSSMESSSEEDKKGRHRFKKGPQMPKMETFGGNSKEDWDMFIYQFQRQAKRYHWKGRKKATSLLDLLRGRALEFAKDLKTRDFKKIKTKLGKRFSDKDAPSSARRRLQYVQQKEDSLAEYAQDIQTLVKVAYPKANKRTKRELAVEAFLKGCKDKEAASRAMEKNPKSVPKAVSKVKEAVNNRRALYGSKSTYSSARQVTFELPRQLDESDTELFEVRAVKSVGASKGGNSSSKGYKDREDSPRGYRGKDRSPSGFRDRNWSPEGRKKLSWGGRDRDKSSGEESDRSEMAQILSGVKDLVCRGFNRGNRMKSPPPSPQRLKTSQCFGCKEYGHWKKDCPKGSSESDYCYNCKEQGHKWRECTKNYLNTGTSPIASPERKPQVDLPVNK